MKRTDAVDAIEAVFGTYKSLAPSDTSMLESLKEGKLYELLVLARVIEDLVKRGFSVAFVGTNLKFKAGPGMINLSDPHFRVLSPLGDLLYIFVDIEFLTLSHACGSVSDNSMQHELDIVVVTETPPYPRHDQIALGVECKSGEFKKDLLKQVLGIRRELSLLTDDNPSKLTVCGGTIPVMVPAFPASEFWVAHLDPGASKYAQGPDKFGIQFHFITP